MPKKTSNDNKKTQPVFPVRIHKPSGQWCKKIRQRVYYFGAVKHDPTGEVALAEYLRVKDDLEAGRVPVAVRPADGATVKGLCDAFLSAKDKMVRAGALSQRTFDDYWRVCKLMAEELGRERRVESLGAKDFERLRASMAKRLSHASVGHEVNRIRVVLNYGVSSGLLEKPVAYGDSLKRPAARLLRLERAARGSMMLEAETIRAAIEAAGPQLRAMVLLGVNCGLGNADVGRLEWRHVDLAAGWLDYPRPKTGVRRRGKLWPETVAALEGLGKARSGLVFVTSRGNSFAKPKADNPVAKEFRKLLIEIKHHRVGVGFYGLRRAFETIAGESRDQVAVDYVMGHAPESDDMASVYRQRISDDRLQAVADVVHAWVFPPPELGPPKPSR
jgi:integrase